MTEPTILPGLSEWAGAYDAIISDVWGVLHDGETVHPGASDALQRFRAGGGSVLLVSNSPRPGPLVIEQLTEMGVPRDAYDDALSSGDIARAWLAERPGLKVGLITAPMHEAMHDGLDLKQVGADEAEYLVVTALEEDETEAPEDYRDWLAAFREQDVPFLCANPDFVVERGGRLIHCAGALADMYREMGGRVIDTGKPSAIIYDAAMERLAAIRGSAPETSRVLAIGDAIRTDVRGAEALGVDMLFVARGIHAEDAMEDGRIALDRAGRLFAREGVSPKAVTDLLRW